MNAMAASQAAALGTRQCPVDNRAAQSRLREGLFATAQSFGPAMMAGVTLGDWVRVLRENGFAIDPRCWPRAAAISAFGALNFLGGVGGAAVRSADAELRTRDAALVRSRPQISVPWRAAPPRGGRRDARSGGPPAPFGVGLGASVCGASSGGDSFRVRRGGGSERPDSDFNVR